MSKVGNQSANNHLLKIGMIINHDRFGKGKILQIEGLSDNKKAIISFEGIGKENSTSKICQIRNY